MYNQYDLARRKNLVSLVRLGKEVGFNAGLNCNYAELTREDEEKLVYDDNRVDERINLLEKSDITQVLLIFFRMRGMSLEKCGDMFRGFINSYSGLLEKNSLDYSERSYKDLFLAETVNYSAELDRYANRFPQYDSMNWDAKPQPRNPVLRENRKGIIGFLRGLRLKK